MKGAGSFLAIKSLKIGIKQRLCSPQNPIHLGEISLAIHLLLCFRSNANTLYNATFQNPLKSQSLLRRALSKNYRILMYI